MKPCWILALALFLPGGSAVAQADRGERGSRGRVILYAEADFRGAAIVLYPGDRIEDFARQSFDNGEPANDRISSVEIEGPWTVVLHADARFRGDALRLDESVSNLADLPGPSRRGNWNDLVSSAAVGRDPERRRPWRGGTGRGPVRGPRVELYSDSNYRGSRLVLVPGDRIENLADAGFDDDEPANDRISSIRIFGDAAIVAHVDGGFRGAALRVAGDLPNLAYRSDGLPNGNWNDRISAVAVITAPDPDPAALVTRVYAELFGAPPDASTLDEYVALVESRGLGEAGLRTELRRTRAYRERDAAEAVRRAYRELLRRDPDESGLATYTRLMVDEGWSEARVREALRRSDEFRQRQPGRE